jgi:exodeoxyribonuclease VII large subunit
VNRQVVSVGLLTSYLRALLESDELLADLWVEGEIADAFVARSGHTYFTLRDGDGQLKCVVFRAQAQRLRTPPRPGDQVAAHGRISVYERDGTYQLYVDLLQPAGLGILALQLELLRQQLAAEGLFEPSRKRPIPSMPSCIGVVTSAEGAVWHDIQNVLRRRYPLVDVLLAAAPVQGDTAPAGIVAALRALQTDGRAQVVILARGGGSADDLWCFNDERVVRAIFASTIPVVTGIGHETDWTLADDVADLRAPTPSAAAELCSPSVVDLAARLVDAQRTADRLIDGRLKQAKSDLDAVTSSCQRRSPRRAIAASRVGVDGLRAALWRHRDHGIAEARVMVGMRQGQARRAIGDALAKRRHGIELDRARLVALDPGSVLRRGYAHLTPVNETAPITTVSGIAARDRFSARLADGVIVARVEGVDQRTIVPAGVPDGGH